MVHYDAANDRVISLAMWDGKGSVAAYDPEKHEWEAGSAVPAEVVASKGCVHGFYSPEVNAHFVYVAGDSDDRGTMWAYRYRNPKK
jgi:dTDP-4-dehydrorhamnose 3,5-epimerase-like enzyme